jgi:hypothetical protein
MFVGYMVINFSILDLILCYRPELGGSAMLINVNDGLSCPQLAVALAKPATLIPRSTGGSAPLIVAHTLSWLGYPLRLTSGRIARYTLRPHSE